MNLKRYVDFWNETEPPEAVAMLRIGFGACATWNLVEQLLHDTVLEIYVKIGEGGIFSAAEPANFFSLFHYVEPTAALVWIIIFTQMVASVLLTIGFFSRFSALLFFVIQITLFDRMVMFRYGGDAVFCVLSWLMVLTPGGAAYSVDSWLRKRSTRDVPAWPRRLWMAQVTIIYTKTGIVKVGTMWYFVDGWSAVYLAVNLPGIARWNGEWAAYVYPLTQIGTFITSWWELTFFIVPLNQFFRRAKKHNNRLVRLIAKYDLRKIYLILGIFVHVAIWVILDVGLFSLIMLCSYLSFLKPSEIRAMSAIASSLRTPPTPTATK